MTQGEVAKAVDWSLSKVIRIEGGTVGVSSTDLKALLQLYGITDVEYTKDLVGLAKEGRTRPWWDSYRNVVNPEFASYLGYESAASTIRQVQNLVIPGLLQTAAYAEAITSTFADYDTTKGIVQLRLERQERLFGQYNPPLQHYILDEAAIRRRGGVPQPSRHGGPASASPGYCVEPLVCNCPGYPIHRGSLLRAAWRVHAAYI